VLGHLSPTQIIAAGLRPPPDLSTSLAATQAAWRFYANDAVTLPTLAGPLIDAARASVAAGACDGTSHLLVALDWSPLHYGGHAARADRVALNNRKDLGYELLTALAISDRDGSPLAPVCLELRAADGTHSTRAAALLSDDASQLDTLAPVMAHVAGLGLSPPGQTPVFVIDREADSVAHFRAWDAAGHRFIVRADDRPRVVHQGVTRPLGEVADLLSRRRAGGGGAAFADVGEVSFEGRPARQFVAETAVVLQRPARTHRVDKQTGKAVHKNVAGEPLSLRLIVSEVRDDRGNVLARWLLLTNLPPSAAPAATIALWYYWRWRIESYHKLLKGAGQQVEHWQQETAAALARRLLVAAMACVVVWRLARDERPQAAELRGVLVRLSGRQMKRGANARGFTEPALLAGLGVLIPMLVLLEHHDLDHLRALARDVLPDLHPPPTRTRGKRA